MLPVNHKQQSVRSDRNECKVEYLWSPILQEKHPPPTVLKFNQINGSI